jgi:hypothetical protein
MANIGSIVGTTVGVRLGAAVKVAVGSSVFVGMEVDEGSGVLVGASVGVTAEKPGKPQLVSKEKIITNTKYRICFKENTCLFL